MISRSNVFNLDNTIPIITLLGSNPVNLMQGDSYTDAGATATDNIDGTITSRIVTTGTVNPSTAGTYTITYNVSDNAGNAATSISRTVNVISRTINFAYSPSDQIWTVPATGTYTIEVWGAGGNAANYGAIGGKGGYAKANFNLTQGQQLTLRVGSTSSGGAGGPGTLGGGNGGAGGGGAFVFMNSTPLIVAGGGGGGAGSGSTGSGGRGGDSGSNGISGNAVTGDGAMWGYGGEPGTNSGPGWSYGGRSGDSYSGGNGETGESYGLSNGGGGGGGSGYYGGGGGQAGYYGGGGGGGGGANYISSSGTSPTSSNGIWTSNGKATITLLP
jgi:hypothetical protein